MFFYYTAITVLTLFSQIVMLTVFRSDNLLPKENKKYFILAFVTFILATFLEWFSDFIRIYGTNTFNYTLTQAVMHITIPLIAYFFGCGFSKFDNIKPFKILFSVNVFIQLLSFTPFFENVFHHVFKLGNTYILYFSIVLYVLHRMFVNIYQVSKAYQSKRITFLMINTSLIAMFSIVVQSLSDGINTIFITSTANAIILYCYFGSLINRRDGLTSLLNRRCFKNRIKSLKHDSVFLFIDLNKFKEINDVHGHIVGDQILIEIADICLATFSSYGSAYRIGGDEYCIILRKSFDDVEALIETLHTNIAIKRITSPLLPSVSVGYGYYMHNKNTVNDALNEADAMMYKLKNKHKISKLEI